MIRVLLVNDSGKPCSEWREALRGAGYAVRQDVASVGGLLKALESQPSDVIVIEVQSPSRDALEQLAVLHQHAPRPVLMISTDGNDEVIRAAISAGVNAYVVGGVAPAQLASTLQVARAHFEQQSQTRRKLDEVQQQLADRKLVDRGKRLLMERRGMSEDAAYAALRAQAMNRGLKVADVARQLIAMADLLG